jgi:hypothetical protein
MAAMKFRLLLAAATPARMLVSTPQYSHHLKGPPPLAGAVRRAKSGGRATGRGNITPGWRSRRPRMM